MAAVVKGGVAVQATVPRSPLYTSLVPQRACNNIHWQQLHGIIVHGPDTLNPPVITYITKLCEDIPLPLPQSTMAAGVSDIQPIKRVIDAVGFDEYPTRYEKVYPTLLEYAVKHRRPKIAMALMKVGVTVATRNAFKYGLTPERLLGSSAITGQSPCSPSLFRHIIQHEMDNDMIGGTSWNRWCIFRCYIDHILPLSFPVVPGSSLDYSMGPSYHRTEYWRIIWQLWYHYSSIHQWPPYLAIDKQGRLITPIGTYKETRAQKDIQTFLNQQRGLSRMMLSLQPNHEPQRQPFTQLDAIIDYVIYSLRYSSSCLEQALMPVTHPYGISADANETTVSTSSTTTTTVRHNDSKNQLLRLVGSQLVYDNVITSLRRLFYGGEDEKTKLWKWSAIPSVHPHYFDALHLVSMVSSSSLMSLIGGSSSLQLPTELPICTESMRRRKPSSRWSGGAKSVTRQYPDTYARWLAIHVLPPEPRLDSIFIPHPHRRTNEPYWYNSLLRYQLSSALEQVFPHLLTITPLPAVLCRLVRGSHSHVYSRITTIVHM
jgi:hypothetical protein